MILSTVLLSRRNVKNQYFTNRGGGGKFFWSISRHLSNKGSIIEYKDANYIKRKIIVLDAEYRSSSIKFFSSRHNSLFSSLPNYDISGSIGSKNISAIQPIPENFIDNLFVYNKFKQMSNSPDAITTNSKWLNFDSCPAIKAAQNYTIIDNSVEYIACIPTLYQLIMIWAFSDIIDELDITSELYPDKKLGYTNSSGRFPRVWSATQGTIKDGYLTILGILNCQIYAYGTVSGTGLVVPIIEIP